MPSPDVRRPAGLGEASASLVAVLLTLAVAWHGFGVYFCLGGTCSHPTDQEILVYRLLATALGVTVVLSLALAARRRATAAFVWHLSVTVVAAGVGTLFAVPQIDVRELTEPETPAENPAYVPCYSGSNDCVGG